MQACATAATAAVVLDTRGRRSIHCRRIGRRWSRPHPPVRPSILMTSSAIADLPFTRHTLANGLRVVLHPDQALPLVAINLWYHVGSKNERPGRTGFAHFFEHMMFKGSKNVEAEGHPSYISSVGGQSNAYTTEDATVFWETVPAQYLPLVLWLEADRMASLKIDEKVFKNEREVVKEERRMRIENQPYGRLQEIIS